MDNFEDYDSTIKSAGILFYRTNKNNISVLLGKTMREEEEKSKWSLLGGRKEHKDKSVYDLAIREFNEESAGIFEVMLKEVDLYEILERSVSIRVNRLKYVIFIVSIDDENLGEYTDYVYERFNRTLNEDLPPYMKEMCELDWMPYTTLFDIEKITPFMRNRVARSIELLRFFNDMYIDLTLNVVEERVSEL
jgi:hypothetical protein